jgi:hypothetical protein
MIQKIEKALHKGKAQQSYGRENTENRAVLHSYDGGQHSVNHQYDHMDF